MGLFDGIKDAFSAPAMEQSILDKDRETPIDRWMGWSVVSNDESGTMKSEEVKANEEFVDSMNEINYVSTDLTKPMGIVFEENDDDVGGIFVLSLKEGGEAEQNGKIKPGDQLVAVNNKKVTGLAFDDALGSIIDCEKELVHLTFFQGSSNQLYGPTGPSREWLDEFISAKSKVEVQ